jgi:dTDP-4-dehydrorhamnose 3,5-epimerase
MINDVKIKKLIIHSDDRGNFIEILRDDDNLMKHFGQASITITNPGIIKAFHCHERQTDFWFVVSGYIKVVLYDLRESSPTYKQTQVVYMGDLSEPKLLLIPVGVAHGYQVLGNKPATLVYFTTESYDPKSPDEKRIPFDDPEIGFEWKVKNR